MARGLPNFGNEGKAQLPAPNAQSITNIAEAPIKANLEIFIVNLPRYANLQLENNYGALGTTRRTTLHRNAAAESLVEADEILRNLTAGNGKSLFKRKKRTLRIEHVVEV